MYLHITTLFEVSYWTASIAGRRVLKKGDWSKTMFATDYELRASGNSCEDAGSRVLRNGPNSPPNGVNSDSRECC